MASYLDIYRHGWLGYACTVEVLRRKQVLKKKNEEQKRVVPPANDDLYLLSRLVGC